MEAKDELTARCEAATGEASHQTSRAEKAEEECASLVDLRASAESAATEALEKLQVAQEELANIKQQLEAASALAAEREEGLVAAAANGNVTKHASTVLQAVKNVVTSFHSRHPQLISYTCFL